MDLSEWTIVELGEFKGMLYKHNKSSPSMIVSEANVTMMIDHACNDNLDHPMKLWPQKNFS